MKMSIEENFLRRFIVEHTDGSYYYVALREEDPEAKCLSCGGKSELRWFDVEDREPGGAPMCRKDFDAFVNEEVDGKIFYRPSGADARAAWNGESPEPWRDGWKCMQDLFSDEIDEDEEVLALIEDEEPDGPEKDELIALVKDTRSLLSWDNGKPNPEQEV